MKHQFKKWAVYVWVAAGLMGASFLWPRSFAGESAIPAQRKIAIPLDGSSVVAIPNTANPLKPVLFKTPDGKDGWVVRIPGSRPIATPAFADGMIFVGGGYGSHEFYAFNADTGKLIWKIQTGDDGPTAAVTEEGFVAFNTESCTLVVVDAKTGKVVWQEWLGDPLMSQPAISRGRVFIAYPAGQRSSNQANFVGQPPKPTARGGHSLLALDLRTGRHLWEREITGDVISAPVVSGDTIYFTCFDGTSFALGASDGKIVWKKIQSATSAPLIADNHVIVTRKEQVSGSIYEGLNRLDVQAGNIQDKGLLAKEKADYLSKGKGRSTGLSENAQVELDSGVGFSNAPPAAQLGTASDSVNVETVAGAWAYQGSRAAYSRGQMLNAQGSFVNSIRAKDGTTAWRAEARGREVNGGVQIFSPPSLGRESMYLSTALGHLISLRQSDGKLQFSYFFKKPMVFQPALALGNVYVGTGDGFLICLKTGSNDADGWYAWGGNAQHNKTQ